MRRRAAMTVYVFRLSLALALMVSLAPGALSQSDPGAKRAAAKLQFERAEKARADLEARPQTDRHSAEYLAVVNSYRRVYHITPHAAEVPAALVAVAELYQKMGRQFDRKYFQSAIDAYQFLLHEYPQNRYRADALLAIGNIQKDELDQPELAQKTFESLLALHPRSSQAQDARGALQEIAEQKAQAQKPAVSAEHAAAKADARDAAHKWPQVTRIHTWNAADYTRVIIDLEDSVEFDSARIKDPDRIYFDLHQAKLISSLAGKTIDVQGGFLRTVRVAQNQAGVVRVVLDVAKVKDFSAYLLTNPYRLVVDVYGEAVVAKAPAKTPQDAAVKSPPSPDPKAGQNSNGTQTADAAPFASKSQQKTASQRTGPAASAPSEELAAAQPPKSVPAATGKAAAGSRGKATREAAAAISPPAVPQPTKNGEHSLTRALGLKIGRIVIDAGHGGHDTGTIGPTGLMEKDLCLDVALRLGKLIQQRLPGAEVVYTRSDDTFIPLEDRTIIANKAQADLFLSIHANSSPDHRARGVETYYLSFATSPEALEVASRENALAQGSIHELQDLVQKIARNEKIEESREFAGDVQESLLKRLQRQSRGLKDRGVHKAPFVVLIGANMPSVLAEISFISNPADEQALKKPDGRQRVAEALYHGVESYLQSLNSITYNQPKPSPLAAGTR